MDVGGIVIGGPEIEDTICGLAGLGCGCGIGCKLALVIFLVAPALPCSFLGRSGGILL